MNRPFSALVPVWILAASFCIAIPASAQNFNECDPGEAPDVIVGDLFETGNYGSSGDYYGYAVGTTSCNIGDCWLNWFSGTNQHPVIAQNMYRIKDGRLEQVGQSWLKHGFFALSENLCALICLSTDGTHLGVNCSDPYTASLNGSQGNLGPRHEVNPYTGVFPYPFTGIGDQGDEVFRRIRVHRDDLDPALNAGATYFVEGQYVTQDDAAAGNGLNNLSWREIDVDPSTFDISLTGATMTSQSAILAWKEFQPSVIQTIMDVAGEGQFQIGSDTFLSPDGTRRYVYAIQNVNSDRAGQSFSIPVPQGAVVTNIGFNDIDSHSGEPYDTADWDMYYDYPKSRIVWETEEFANNEFANPLRWGTAYSFWFDIVDTNSTVSLVELDLFKPVALPGDPESAVSISPMDTPSTCIHDGICQPGETCINCPVDCAGLSPPQDFCGDGVCDIALGEDCTNCLDCNGVQSGTPSGRYCCGAGGGSNPIPCTDSRCTAGGMECGTGETPYCCGNGVCESGETLCSCIADCGPAPPAETTCNDGNDDDCDGLVDCLDSDCCADGSCATGNDNDMDGVSDCDCDDGNASVWGRPSPTGTLTLSETSGATLTWTAPANPGAASVTYEALRVESLELLEFVASCLADADPTDLVASDAADPDPGGVFHYLVRATNGCPGPAGNGSLGPDSNGADRKGASCSP